MKIIYSFDLFFAKLANNLLNGFGTVLTPAFKVVTLLGNMGLVFVVAAISLLFFKKTRFIGVVALGALFFGFLFTNVALKHIVARNRPFIDKSSPFYNFWVAAGSLKESGYSFPSGHTASAAAFAVTVALAAKKRAAAFALIIPFVMGFTRIYFGVHYATDILGGLIVGTIAAEISVLIVSRIFPVVLNKFSRKNEENNS